VEVSPVNRRFASVAIVVSVAAFMGLEAAAMLLYPGGTWWDPTSRGSSISQNYLCDFEHREAIDGAANPIGSRLAQAAMFSLVLGLMPFWIATPSLMGRGKAGPAVRALGLVSLFGVVAAILLPSDRFGRPHGVAVIAAGGPGLVAAALAVRALFRCERRPRVVAWLGAATLAVAGVDFIGFAMHLIAGGLGTPLLPALQKAALTLLLAWMVAIAIRVAGRSTAPRAHSGPDPRRRFPHTRP
jgi:hypothetical protein